MLPDDNTNILTVSLLISYCNFSSLILSWFSHGYFYILSERFFLKSKTLSDARVVSFTSTENGFAVSDE